MFTKSNLLILCGLAMATFAIGLTEFISVGILPLIAKSFNISILSAGLTVSVYAFTVTIATPLIIKLFAHHSKRTIIILSLIILVIGNIVSSLSTNFTMLLFSRFICALSHGIFMAIATIIVTETLPENQKSMGIAIMFAGLTLSTILGVPFDTFLGNTLGWRATFLFLSLIGVISIIYNIIFLPSHLTKNAKILFNDIFKNFTNKSLVLIFIMTALGYGGTFAPFTYISPILSIYGGFSNYQIIVILMLYRACIAIGNIIGGKLGNNSLPKLLFL